MLLIQPIVFILRLLVEQFAIEYIAFCCERVSVYINAEFILYWNSLVLPLCIMQQCLPLIDHQTFVTCGLGVVSGGNGLR